MFKSIANWMRKPITWGGYFKLCGIAWLIGAIITAISWLYISGINVFDMFKKSLEKVKKRSTVEIDLELEEEESF